MNRSKEIFPSARTIARIFSRSLSLPIGLNYPRNDTKSSRIEARVRPAASVADEMSRHPAGDRRLRESNTGGRIRRSRGADGTPAEKEAVFDERRGKQTSGYDIIHPDALSSLSRVPARLGGRLHPASSSGSRRPPI